MNSKALAIFGIGTYILSVFSSATDLEYNSVAPIALIAISGMVTIMFYAMATIRLWKMQKSAPILLISSAVILGILSLIQGVAPLFINIINLLNLLVFLWVISLLWVLAKHERRVEKLHSESGLTSEEMSLVQENLRKGDHEAVVEIIAKAQEQHRKIFKETTGVDAKDIVPEIGQEISWSDIVNHAFRVLEFDRNETIIDEHNQIKAKSSLKPYGYLLVESPILNNNVKLPIIHRDDFLLAASVFDEPKLEALVKDEELLVTYSPKHLLAKGLSGSPHHVLHYVITPRGTLDSYYSRNNDMYMAKPNPQKLFGPFVYQGEIKVQINQEPETLPKILVIDDDPKVLWILEEGLAKHYDFVAAYDGTDGIQKAITEAPNLILLSINMPGMSGLEVLKILGGFERRPEIIMISGYDDAPTIVESIKGGASVYITKPFDVEVVAAYIDQALNKGDG